MGLTRIAIEYHRFATGIEHRLRRPVTCLKDAYVKRIAWLKNPLQSYSGTWVSKKYRIITFVDADSPKPVVRFYAGPKDADFMLMELQARFVSAKDNQQEGTDAVQVTPQFQPAFRKHEIQCTAVSINFNKDGEAYLVSNEQCPLFKKNDKDAELKLKEALYYYTSSK